MVKIGVDNLVYALMDAEDTVDTLPTYGDVKRAPGIISININPNGSIETLFTDNGPMETASTTGAIEVEINKAYLSTENKADFLGHVIDANGGIVYSDTDVPPWMAIGFRSLKSNGKYRYTWLYKGKFTEPEDSNETKADGVNFQTETITGNFVKVTKEIAIAGKKLRPWKYDLDEDYTEANERTIEAFFDEPKFPSATKDV